MEQVLETERILASQCWTRICVHESEQNEKIDHVLSLIRGGKELTVPGL